jgi:hypothetical protein
MTIATLPTIAFAGHRAFDMAQGQSGRVEPIRQMPESGREEGHWLFLLTDPPNWRPSLAGLHSDP